MSTISSSFQDHIDADKTKAAAAACPLVLKENNLHNEQYNTRACDAALSQICDNPCEGDMFSLKLTQISDQNTISGDSNCQTKKEKTKKEKIFVKKKREPDVSEYEVEVT